LLVRGRGNTADGERNREEVARGVDCLDAVTTGRGIAGDGKGENAAAIAGRRGGGDCPARVALIPTQRDRRRWRETSQGRDEGIAGFGRGWSDTQSRSDNVRRGRRASKQAGAFDAMGAGKGGRNFDVGRGAARTRALDGREFHRGRSVREADGHVLEPGVAPEGDRCVTIRRTDRGGDQEQGTDRQRSGREMVGGDGLDEMNALRRRRDGDPAGGGA